MACIYAAHNHGIFGSNYDNIPVPTGTPKQHRKKMILIVVLLQCSEIGKSCEDVADEWNDDEEMEVANDQDVTIKQR